MHAPRTPMNKKNNTNFLMPSIVVSKPSLLDDDWWKKPHYFLGWTMAKS
jgi:hypothetical protein